MISSLGIALTGLEAATKKISAAASNIANAGTTGSLENGKQAPYTPITTQQTAQTDTQGNGQGVRANFVPRPNPFTPAFDPDSPFADENGLIGVPDVSFAEEAVNLKLAEFQFRANIKTIETVSELSEELFHIFDEEA